MRDQTKAGVISLVVWSVVFGIVGVTLQLNREVKRSKLDVANVTCATSYQVSVVPSAISIEDTGMYIHATTDCAKVPE